MKSTVLLLIIISSTKSWRLKRFYNGDGRFDLTPNSGGEQACVTKNGTAGICVHFGQCFENHKLAIHGNIDDSELRAGNCPGKFDWCCTEGEYNSTDMKKTPVTVKPPSGQESCVTKDGAEGLCVNEGKCFENLKNSTYGVIDDDELRVGNCPRKSDLCCSIEEFNSTDAKKSPLNEIPKPGKCTIPTPGQCPWCVAIYRDAGNPRTKNPSGLYCSGTLIAPRLVLTAAGCVISAAGQNVWVQLPANAKKYNVLSSHKHSEYNSGTREHDIAIMVLSEDVHWSGDKKLGGACLGLRSELVDQCYTVGFDKQDRIIYTNLNVTKGSCNDRGAVNDVACGHFVSSTTNNCEVTFGSPVLCGSGKGVILKGVARDKCLNSKVSLGALSFSETWLTSKFGELGLNKQNYTIT